MSRLVWQKPEDKLAQSGLDLGVLYPQDKPAVPWNGLVSVNESGSQETSSYYIDGRRYLTTVTPREYSATLTAYTFPDEFAEVCGIVEAADGLFLDAQIPDQFGLCYRTMYSDGVHYKIHVVYGVTASMSDVEYQTLSSDSDATPFEFEISAVPQSVQGFRPTAHVILDSRKLGPHLLATIENKLYGSYGQEAYLPTIDSLYEMMNFGDTVVIDDKEDGTWTAEGSYRNIVVNDSTGEFTISNISFMQHDNDTYTIGSTDEDIIVDGGNASTDSATITDGGTADGTNELLLDGNP